MQNFRCCCISQIVQKQLSVEQILNKKPEGKKAQMIFQAKFLEDECDQPKFYKILKNQFEKKTSENISVHSQMSRNILNKISVRSMKNFPLKMSKRASIEVNTRTEKNHDTWKSQKTIQ